MFFCPARTCQRRSCEQRVRRTLGKPVLLLWVLSSLAFLLLTPSLAQSNATADGYAFIDCGGYEGKESNYSIPGDTVFSLANDGWGIRVTVNGSTTVAKIPDNIGNLTPQERTLRVFPSSGGCYNVLVNTTTTKYSVRLGFAYYNYDGKGQYPNFTVSLQQGVEVDLVYLGNWEGAAPGDSGVAQDASPSGNTFGQAHYTEYIIDVLQGSVEVCLATASGISNPILNTMEIVPLPNQESISMYLKEDMVLSLKHRANMGGPPFRDSMHRNWRQENDSNDCFLQEKSIQGHKDINTTAIIQDAGTYSQLMLQTAWEGNMTSADGLGVAIHFYPMSPSSLFLARVFLVELDPTVAPGERHFEAFLTLTAFSDSNTDALSPPVKVDIASFNSNASTGANGTLSFSYLSLPGCIPEASQGQPGSLQIIWLCFRSLPGSTKQPIMSGLELYEVIPRSPNHTYCPIDYLQANGAQPYGPSSDSPYPTSSGGLSTGAIVGIVLASVVGVTLLGVIAFVLMKRRKPQLTEFERFDSETDARLAVGH